jgi:hypothetical protein
MNIKQVRRFVKRISNGSLTVKYSNDSSMRYVAACACIKDDEIWLSRKHFMGSNDLFQRSCLLHEIGHFNDNRKIWDHVGELNAHLWAIKKANSLGWCRIKKHMIKEIKEYWHPPKTTWNEDSGMWRKYIKASKMYRKMKGPKNGRSKTI